MAGVQTSPILKHRAIEKFSRRSAVVGACALELHDVENKLMVNCPRCDAAVREEKAFCQNCGSPMNAEMAKRDASPMPDFGATVIEPPRKIASPPPLPPPLAALPATREVQPISRETAPVSYPSVATGGVSVLPSPPIAPSPSMPPIGRVEPSRKKIGIGFVLLVLFLMFAAFVIALWLD
jgi:hypothetical protein